MPIYDYVCSACGHRFEVLRGLNEAGPGQCPLCEGPVTRAFAPPTIVFKGSGWAKVDRRYSGAPTKKGSSGEGRGGSGSGSSGDRAPARAANTAPTPALARAGIGIRLGLRATVRIRLWLWLRARIWLRHVPLRGGRVRRRRADGDGPQGLRRRR